MSTQMQAAAALEQIPNELTALDQWACWQWQRRHDKGTKIPLSAATGAQARSNDPETWASFEAALSYMKRRSLSGSPLSGMGFMFHPADDLAGVDLDGCRNSESGEVEPWAREIVSRLDSYAEVSPSGTGVKVFVRGQLPPRGRRKGSIEMYDRGRFFTTTGHRLRGVPAEVRDAQDALIALHVRLFGEQDAAASRAGTRLAAGSAAAATLGGARLADAELLEMARNAANGEKFSRLYFGGDTAGYATASNDGRSEADLALCSLLAFWCGPDPERIDRLFRGSALCREKWFRRPDYRELTISQALDTALERREFFSGRVRLSGARRVRRTSA